MIFYWLEKNVFGLPCVGFIFSKVNKNGGCLFSDNSFPSGSLDTFSSVPKGYDINWDVFA